MSEASNRPNTQSVMWENIFSQKQKKKKKHIIDVLKNIPLFESLKYTQLKFIANIMHVRDYEEGESIFEINQPGAALFIVQEGDVSIFIPENDSEKNLAELHPGTFFGELALLDQTPRSASAKAKTNCKILALFRKDLDELIDHQPEIASRIYQSLAILIGERLKATNKLV